MISRCWHSTLHQNKRLGRKFLIKQERHTYKETVYYLCCKTNMRKKNVHYNIRSQFLFTPVVVTLTLEKLYSDVYPFWRCWKYEQRKILVLLCLYILREKFVVTYLNPTHLTKSDTDSPYIHTCTHTLIIVMLLQSWVHPKLMV